MNNELDCLQNNKFPDISLTGENNNPTLESPNKEFAISFYQTKETLCDSELYNRFVKNAIRRFRNSISYKHYKSFLISLGLDHCQVLGNITSEMATVEMHHQILNIHDIAVIITESTLNTYGKISTFDLAYMLKQEHFNNRVALVMLSLTPHQLYHNTEELFIHPDMCIGQWWEFLKKYRYGITKDIAFKVLFYLKQAIDEGGTNDHEILKIRDDIMDWSNKNIGLFYK